MGLPTSQVPFSSDEGRRLFREALMAEGMENYFCLAEQFRTQDEPTFCGLSTLAMVLNSLRIDPMRTWKGAWRWFNEQNLGCCANTGPEQVRESGLSFDMFRCLAGCNGADVTAYRAPHGGGNLKEFEQKFRTVVRQVSRSRARECLVVSYSREALGQSGAGHFSPVGGYHEESDRVLIMDVARFKYPPHWVELSTVVQAMAHVDLETGLPRGCLHVRLDYHQPHTGGVLAPLHTPFVPPAAGKRLSEALAVALAEPSTAESCTSTPSTLLPTAAPEAAIRRWLHAVGQAEPQVIRQLLRVGDTEALHEVLHRLHDFPKYLDLCNAYAVTVAAGGCSGVAGYFPPLLNSAASPLRYLGTTLGSNNEAGTAHVSEISLDTCGELWVILLLLLPDHLRGAVWEDLAGPWVAQTLARTVRGPWALPLEALREALGHILPPLDNPKSCRPRATRMRTEPTSPPPRISTRHAATTLQTSHSGTI